LSANARSATALLLAAHGERRPAFTPVEYAHILSPFVPAQAGTQSHKDRVRGSGPPLARGRTENSNEGVFRLAETRHACRVVAQVGCGFIKGAPTIAEALAAFTADEIIVYPLFLSDGYFVRVRLAELLHDAMLGARPRPIHVLPPLGLDPGFAAFVAEKATAAARARGLAPAGTSLVLLAHGSRSDPASRLATERLTDRLCGLRRFRTVRMALLDEAPSLAQTAADLPGPVLVLGLFAGEGLHGAADAARLVAELDRPDLLFAGTIGSCDGIDDLIAAAVERAMLATNRTAPFVPA